MPLAGPLGLRGGHGSPERTGQSLHLTQEVEGHRTEANLRYALHPALTCILRPAAPPQLPGVSNWSQKTASPAAGAFSLEGSLRALSSFASTLRWGLNVSCLEHVGSPAGWSLVPGPGTERGVPRKANGARLEPAEPLGEDVRVPMEGPRGRAGAR